jgi:hypothetical protein
MTYREAAEHVLRDRGVPMTAAEITDSAQRLGLIEPRGPTPVNTMSATLYRERPNRSIRREERRGAQRAARGSVRWKYGADSLERASTARGSALR